MFTAGACFRGIVYTADKNIITTQTYASRICFGAGNAMLSIRMLRVSQRCQASIRKAPLAISRMVCNCLATIHLPIASCRIMPRSWPTARTQASREHKRINENSVRVGLPKTASPLPKIRRAEAVRSLTRCESSTELRSVWKSSSSQGRVCLSS